MRTIAALAAVLALVGTSCSKKEESSTPKSSAAPVALQGIVNQKETKDLTASGAEVELSLEIDDFYFNPTFIKATPGAKVNVELENEGDNQHTFTIDAPKVDETLDPGKKIEVTFTLPSTGAVSFYCRFHKAQGMQGAFYVA